MGHPKSSQCNSCSASSWSNSCSADLGFARASGRLWATGDNSPKRSQFRPGRLFRSPNSGRKRGGCRARLGHRRRYRSLVVSPRLSPPWCPQCCPGVTAMGDRAPGGPRRARSRALQLLHLGKVGSTQGCSQPGDRGVFWGHPLPGSPSGFPGGLWAPAGATRPIPKRGGAPSPPRGEKPPGMHP